VLSERQCNRGVLIDGRQVGTGVLWYIGTKIATRAGFVGDSFPNTTGTNKGSRNSQAVQGRACNEKEKRLQRE
jgi:hypothetical protein